MKRMSDLILPSLSYSFFMMCEADSPDLLCEQNVSLKQITCNANSPCNNPLTSTSSKVPVPGTSSEYLFRVPLPSTASKYLFEVPLTSTSSKCLHEVLTNVSLLPLYS